MVDNFFDKYNVAAKLKNAIEDLRVGRGLHKAFRGLETGVCTVDVVYNGETITFVNKMLEEKPVEPEVPVETETTELPETKTDAELAKPIPEVDSFAEESKPIKRRRNKLESSES